MGDLLGGMMAEEGRSAGAGGGTVTTQAFTITESSPRETRDLKPKLQLTPNEPMFNGEEQLIAHSQR